MIILYNDVFNQRVKLNDKYEKMYSDLNQNTRTAPEWLPYVTLDGKKQGLVFFGKRNEMLEFLKNKKQVDNFMSKYRNRQKLPLDLTSLTDFYKMNDSAIPLENRFQYLYLVEDRAANHFKFLVPSVNNIYLNTNIKNALIPALFKSYETTDLVQLNNLYVGKDLIEKINSDIFEHKGHILYNLFFGFNNFLIQNETEFKKGATEGLNVRELKILLDIRQNNIKKYVRLINKSNIKCSNDYDEFIDELSQIKNTTELIQNYQQYYAKYEELRMKFAVCENIELLLDDTVYASLNETCNNIILSREDSLTCPYVEVCDTLLHAIKNNKIQNNLLSYINTIKSENKVCYPNTPSYGNYDKPITNLYEEYMPEWYKFVESNDITQAHKYRQTVIGDRAFTNFIRKCSLLFRSDPFMLMRVNINNVSWNEIINKIIIGCMAQRDITFAIRIIGEVNFNRYRRIKINPEEDILIGSMINKHTSTNNQDFLDHKLLYYNVKSKNFINNTNFRSLSTYHSHLSSESFKVLYIELTLLYYFEQDQGIKLYYYKISNTSESIVLVSKFTIDQINEKYVELGFSAEESKIILGRLEQVELKRDNNKLFYFEKVNLQLGSTKQSSLQKGGKNLDISKYSEIKKAVHLEKLDTEFNVNFSKTNKTFDTEIFPIKKFTKLIKKIESLKELLSDTTLIYNNLAAFKFFIIPLRSHSLISATSQELLSVKNLDVMNKKVKEMLNNLEQYDFNILTYNPNFYLLSVATSINKYSMILNKDNALVFCKNVMPIYTVDQFDINKIIVCNFTNNIDPKFNKEIETYTEKKDYIYVNSISSPMNTDTIDEINELIKKKNLNISFALLDLWLNIPELVNVRSVYTFQTNLSALYVILDNLMVGGDLIIFFPIITNKLVFDFFIYVASLFEQAYIEPNSSYITFSVSLVFKSYLGDYNKKMFRKVIKKMFKYDPSGGNNYEITSTNEQNILDIEYKSKSPPKKYLATIIKPLETPSIDYYSYKSMMSQFIRNYLSIVETAKNIHFNKENPEFMQLLIKNNLRNSYEFAIKYGLKLNKELDFTKLVEMFKIEDETKLE